MMNSNNRSPSYSSSNESSINSFEYEQQRHHDIALPDTQFTPPPQTTPSDTHSSSKVPTSCDAKSTALNRTGNGSTANTAKETEAAFPVIGIACYKDETCWNNTLRLFCGPATGIDEAEEEKLDDFDIGIGPEIPAELMRDAEHELLRPLGPRRMEHTFRGHKSLTLFADFDGILYRDFKSLLKYEKFAKKYQYICENEEFLTKKLNKIRRRRSSRKSRRNRKHSSASKAKSKSKSEKPSKPKPKSKPIEPEVKVNQVQIPFLYEDMYQNVNNVQSMDMMNAPLQQQPFVPFVDISGSQYLNDQFLNYYPVNPYMPIMPMQCVHDQVLGQMVQQPQYLDSFNYQQPTFQPYYAQI